jgi:hypothetical protein
MKPPVIYGFKLKHLVMYKNYIFTSQIESSVSIKKILPKMFVVKNPYLARIIGTFKWLLVERGGEGRGRETMKNS